MTNPLQFGVLLIPFQLMDAAGPLDVLSSSSKPYLKAAESWGAPAGLADQGVDVEFHYIGETMEPVRHTAGFRSTPSTTCDRCPKLDYLLIGGPEPSYIQNLPPVFVKFMRERVVEVETVFTTCSGGMVLAAAGLLDGREATTNHGLVPAAMQMFPDVKWTRDRQWVVSEDGKFWTAGGACAGMDMLAHWVFTKYGREVAEAGYAALDYAPRDVHGRPVPLHVHGLPN